MVVLATAAVLLAAAILLSSAETCAAAQVSNRAVRVVSEGPCSAVLASRRAPICSPIRSDDGCSSRQALCMHVQLSEPVWERHGDTHHSEWEMEASCLIASICSRAMYCKVSVCLCLGAQWAADHEVQTPGAVHWLAHGGVVCCGVVTPCLQLEPDRPCDLPQAVNHTALQEWASKDPGW